MTDADHSLVCGPSGGGKTTLLREIFDRSDTAVFLTPDRDGPNPQDGKLVRTNATYPDDIQLARGWAVEADADVTVIIDEAQLAQSFIDGEGPVADGLHRDRKQHVRYVISTQNPMDLRTRERGYGPIQQARYWTFVGPARDWHTGFFRSNNMADVIEELPTDNYEYVVIDPTAALPTEDKIKYRGRTDPSY